MSLSQKICQLWLPVFVWAGLIFFLSNIPNLKSGLDEDFILRKFAHVLEYLILTFLLWRAFKNSFSLNQVSLMVYPALISVLYAASDEFHQTFVQGRHGCLNDVLIDSIGIFGLFLALKLIPRHSQV